MTQQYESLLQITKARAFWLEVFGETKPINESHRVDILQAFTMASSFFTPEEHALIKEQQKETGWNI